MARKVAYTLVATLLPALVLLSHPELRQVLGMDWRALKSLFSATFEIEPLLPSPPRADPLQQAVLQVEEMTEGQARARGYETLYRQTGKAWLGGYTLRTILLGRTLKRPELTELEVSPTYSYHSIPENQRSKAERERKAEWLLQLATEVEQAEPDNAFPTLVRAYALFSLKRDREGLKAFHEAVQKPRYDSYDDERLRLLVPRSASVETRTYQFAITVLPHLAAFREMARLVTWHAWQAEKRGDYQTALRLSEDVINAGAKLREQGFASVESLVGAYLQHLAFLGKKQKLALEEIPKEEAARRKRAAREFATFARAHGRPDLAERVLQEADLNEELRRLVRFPPDNLFGLSEAEGKRIASLRLTAFLLLACVAGMIGCWLLSGLLTIGSRTRPEPLSIWTAALVVAGVPLALFILGYLALVAPTQAFYQSFLAGTGILAVPWQRWRWVVFLMAALLLGLCLLPPFWRTVRAPLSALGLVVIALLVILYTGLVLYGFDLTRTGWQFTLVYLITVGLGLFWLLVWWWRRKQKIPPTRSEQLVSACVVGLVLLFLLGTSFVLSELPAPQIGVLAWVGMSSLTVFLVVILLLWGLWARLGGDKGREERLRALGRLREAAWRLALICWWSYAVIHLSTLPLRSGIHQRIDATLEKGEVRVLREAKS